MAMHALAEGYLIKGDFGQAERGGGDKLRILRFFPFFFCLKKMDESNKPELFFEEKVCDPPCICFLRLMFFFTRKIQKRNKQTIRF